MPGRHIGFPAATRIISVPLTQMAAGLHAPLQAVHSRGCSNRWVPEYMVALAGVSTHIPYMFIFYIRCSVYARMAVLRRRLLSRQRRACVQRACTHRGFGVLDAQHALLPRVLVRPRHWLGSVTHGGDVGSEPCVICDGVPT